MSAAPSESVPYRVSYSGRVRQRLLRLAEIARERGDGAAFVAAVKEIDRRLRLYPQFGEPLFDLTHEVGQAWLGIIPPLSIRYGVFDEQRVVTVVELPVLMRKTGPDE